MTKLDMKLEVMLPLLLIFYWVAILLYFRIADKFNIIDKPNERSSHSRITLRGGGILVPIAVLVFGVATGFLETPYLIGSILLASIISFWDDIQSLPRWLRLLVQVLSMGALMFQVGLLDVAIWMIPIVFLISVGLINAYNFMDGINGITVLNSMIVLLTFSFLCPPEDAELLVYVLPALAVFGVYNVRKSAKCFAGDIGSISIGYIVLYFMLRLFLEDFDIQFILVLAVYGVDSILTIVHRLILKDNIFEPHRKHLYQYLVHVGKWGHIQVSLLYAVIQAIVSVVLVVNVRFGYVDGWCLTLVILSVLILCYLLLKNSLLKRER